MSLGFRIEVLSRCFVIVPPKRWSQVCQTVSDVKPVGAVKELLQNERNTASGTSKLQRCLLTSIQFTPLQPLQSLSIRTSGKYLFLQ